MYLDGLVIMGDSGRPSIPPIQASFKLGEFEVQPHEEGRLQWLAPTNDYVAKARLEFPDPRLLNPPGVYERVDALITCFRLFKVGYVTAYPVTATSRPSDRIDSKPFQFSFGSTARQPQGGMAYGLKENEIEDLVRFADVTLPLISSGPHVSLKTPAFRFYNRGVDDMARSDYPLAIVDFISCMEALVSPGMAELRHRLAELVALITERDPERKKDAYVKCRDLYEKRSRVVHGEPLEDAVHYVNSAQELAAKTLRFCLGYYSKGLGKDDILADADQVIYGVERDFPNHAFTFLGEHSFRTQLI